MGCDKNKIFSIEDRLAEIQSRMSELEAMKTSKTITTPNGEVGVSNAKGRVKMFKAPNGKYKRSVVIQGQNILPEYKNQNTIDTKPDGVDETRMDDPRLRNGDTVEVQFVENDFWKNNKWQYENEEWKAAPLYLVNQDGDVLDLLESYKENKEATNKRKEIYEAIVAGKKVEMVVKNKMYNFNNIQFAGSPVFMDVRENLSPRLLKDTNGNIIDASENQTPILVAATGIEKDHWGQAGVPKWEAGDIQNIENEEVALAIRNDISNITPKYEGQDMNTRAGQIAAVVLAPDGKYTVAYLSTRTLSNKAIEYVLQSAANQQTENVSQIVGNNTRLENAFKNNRFLNIQSLTTKQGEPKTFINFYSEGHAKDGNMSSLVRLEGPELAKALAGEKFKYSVGVFGISKSDSLKAIELLNQGGSPKAPNPRWVNKKNIVSLPSKGVDIISELRGILKSKRHQVSAELLNSQEAFEIPGFTKPGGYNTYQDYLFDTSAHGEQFNLATDIVNNTAIVNTDIKNMEGSVFFNTTLKFSDLLIDGSSKTVLEASNAKTTLAPGTRTATSGPQIRRRTARSQAEQMAAEKEKLDKCGF